ncbi:hypothetical protein ACJX0J_029791, partial [Zea mays]
IRLVRSRECLYNLSTTISKKMQNHDQKHKHMYAIFQSKFCESKILSSLRSLQKVFSSRGLGCNQPLSSGPKTHLNTTV